MDSLKLSKTPQHSCLKHVSAFVMVMGAGLGTRLHPLTLTNPKPLVSIGQKTLLSYHIDHIQKAGFHHIVMNLHYKGDQIIDFLKTNATLDYTLSMEETLLNTGGGVAKAAAMVDFGGPFFSINSDTYTTGNLFQKYDQLKDAFVEKIMDALLLVCPIHNIKGYEGKGDFEGSFEKNSLSTLNFCDKGDVKNPVVYVGLQLINLSSFQSFVQEYYPEYRMDASFSMSSGGTPFSMMEFWKHAFEKGRLFGCVDQDMTWFDTGNLHGLSLAIQASQE